MKRELFFPIAVVLILLVVALAAIVFFPPPKGLIVEGSLIDSGNEDPYELFNRLSQKNTFLISPQMNERVQGIDHLMFNAMALYLQVIEGNKRNSVQVIRVHNPEGQLVYCLTNHGDVNVSEMLQPEECLEYLSPKKGVVVLIEFPDESLPQPRIEISESRITIKPNSNNGISDTSFLPLRIMFKNAVETVENSNSLLNNLTG